MKKIQKKMKKSSVLLIALLLTGCSSKSSYELAYKALDELSTRVEYYQTIEVNNVLYHAYDEDYSELNELVGLQKVKDSLNDLVDLITLKNKTKDDLKINNVNLVYLESVCSSVKLNDFIMMNLAMKDMQRDYLQPEK